MTEIDFEEKTRGLYYLHELNTGDFFLDEKNHLCIFIECETENLILYYDFHSRKMTRYLGSREVTLIEKITIAY